ncbi:MAG: hypothetical protein AB1714_17430 [Acidobacteriota bacterium]
MLSKRARLSILAAGVLSGLLAITLWFGNTALIALESSAPSRSTGTPAHGALEHGRHLPSAGPNFRAYSRLGALLGRNSVHAVVRIVVLDAYAGLAAQRPDLTFVYGETGWPHGGPFPPHKTHQNGLSVDFMVPVRDGNDRPVPLPTFPWTRFGYDLNFDEKGRLGDLRIDFEAMGEHLAALDAAARAHGTRIELFILAPELQPFLWQTPAGRALQGRFPVMMTPAWVRHDEHYHVDFANPDG